MVVKIKSYMKAQHLKKAIFGILVGLIPLLITSCASMSAERFRQKARIAQEEEDSSQAIKYYLESLSIEPDNHKALISIGRLYYGKGEYDTAEHYLKKAITIKPKDSWSWYWLGWTYRYIKKYPDMRDAFGNAIKFADKKYAWSYVGLGRAHYRLGNHLAGRQNFLEAINLNSNNHRLQENIGRFYTNIGQYDTAERYLKEAIEIKPEDSKSWNSLGWLYRDTEKYPDMRDAFGNAIKFRDKMVPWDYIGLGESYLYLKNTEKAEHAFSEALRADNSLDNEINLIKLKIAIANNNYAAAQRLLKKAPFLGIHFTYIDKKIKVTRVVKGSLADLAGLEINDIITTINGKPLESVKATLNYIKKMEFGQSLDLAIERDARTTPFKIVFDFDYYLANKDGLPTFRVSPEVDNSTPAVSKTGGPEKANIQKPVPGDTVGAKSITRLSIVIGNSNYVHGGDLRNPKNDVRALAATFQELGFEVMKYENVDQRTMKKAIDLFGRKLKDYDVGLFFYAGHGVQVKGTNYLIPIDAKLDNELDVEYDCVNVGRVLAKMEHAANNTNILILDACRDNPFERSWRRGSRGMGLAYMNAPSGTIIAYATSPGSTAADGEGLNGLYTSALLEHINTPKITAMQMFQRVRKTVMDRSSNHQTPWESTSLTDDFYFKL